MKNGNISDQLNMQERQITDERKNTDMQTGVYADTQDEPNENKVAYKQDDNLSNIQSVNQENKNEDKQSFNLPDLGLSSALGLLTPDVNKEEEQIPVKKKRRNLNEVLEDNSIVSKVISHTFRLFPVHSCLAVEKGGSIRE